MLQELLIQLGNVLEGSLEEVAFELDREGQGLLWIENEGSGIAS